MTKNRIAGLVSALALLAAPAVAAAHGDDDGAGHHHGRHHHKHQVRKAQAREVTGAPLATVASFTDGELTITLPSGKSYSGTVTGRTILKCHSATATTSSRGSDDGDDRADDGAKHDQGDDDGNGRCGTGALVAGTKVVKAKLLLQSGDATWKKVELLK